MGEDVEEAVRPITNRDEAMRETHVCEFAIELTRQVHDRRIHVGRHSIKNRLTTLARDADHRLHGVLVRRAWVETNHEHGRELPIAIGRHAGLSKHVTVNLREIVCKHDVPPCWCWKGQSL